MKKEKNQTDKETLAKGLELTTAIYNVLGKKAQDLIDSCSVEL